MIINLTNGKDKYISELISSVTGDCVIDATEKSALEENSLFSEKPYLLVADYSLLIKAKHIINLGKVHFDGSKILYIIFVNDKEKVSDYTLQTFAKDICAVKNKVLFGWKGVRSVEVKQEEDILNAKFLGSYVRDCIPFETGGVYPVKVTSRF